MGELGEFERGMISSEHVEPGLHRIDHGRAFYVGRPRICATCGTAIQIGTLALADFDRRATYHTGCASLDARRARR